MAIDLKGMSRRELEALRARVEKAIAKLDKADMKKALSAAEAAAKQHGFSLSQLTAGAPAKSAKAAPGKKSAPRYRHPDDPKITWTGKGRRPDWIKAGLEKGKSLEDFAI